MGDNETAMKSSFPGLITALLIMLPLVANDGASNSISTISSSAENGQEQPQNNKDKSKKDKTKKKGDADDVEAPANFSESVAYAVLQRLTNGLEAHNDRLMLSAFDHDKMDGYLNFENQVQAFFQQYDSFRIHFRISQATGGDGRGVALADFEMEELSRSADAQAARKHEQIRFEIERGTRGWKIVDFRPRAFFS